MYWQSEDKKILKKINELLRDIERNDNEGLGKPEPLKNELSGYWSRRITNVHRLIYSIDNDNISDIMRNINGFYAREFNNKYGLIGHLFQGRYRSILVERNTYLMEVSRYIHLNPVRAKIVKRPEDYLWSSYRDYLYGYNDLSYTKTILEMVGASDQNQSFKEYRRFVESKINDNQYTLEKEISDGDILGSTEFVREIQAAYF